MERLEGDMGPDGRRSGDVILSLLLPKGLQVRARTRLNADDYAKADLAHMHEVTYIKVARLFHPGRQPRQLDRLKFFELIKR